jgi:hypothetical protein
MTRALAISLVFLAGCVSGPAPDDLVLPQNPSSPDPVRLSEVVRLSKAGVSDPTVIQLLRERGSAEQPGLEKMRRLKSAGVGDGVLRALAATPAAEPPPPRPKVVVRELYLPLWPVYSGGRFRFGIRSSRWHRVEPEARPVAEAPEPEEPLPDTLEP